MGQADAHGARVLPHRTGAHGALASACTTRGGGAHRTQRSLHTRYVHETCVCTRMCMFMCVCIVVPSLKRVFVAHDVHIADAARAGSAVDALRMLVTADAREASAEDGGGDGSAHRPQMRAHMSGNATHHASHAAKYRSAGSSKHTLGVQGSANSMRTTAQIAGAPPTDSGNRAFLLSRARFRSVVWVVVATIRHRRQQTLRAQEWVHLSAHAPELMGENFNEGASEGTSPSARTVGSTARENAALCELVDTMFQHYRSARNGEGVQDRPQSRLGKTDDDGGGLDYHEDGTNARCGRGLGTRTYDSIPTYTGGVAEERAVCAPPRSVTFQGGFAAAVLDALGLPDSRRIPVSAFGAGVVGGLAAVEESVTALCDMYARVRGAWAADLATLRAEHATLLDTV